MPNKAASVTIRRGSSPRILQAASCRSQALSLEKTRVPFEVALASRAPNPRESPWDVAYRKASSFHTYSSYGARSNFRKVTRLLLAVVVKEANSGLAMIVDQQKRLLNLRLFDEIDSETYAEKPTELRDEEARLRLEREASSRGRHEIADIAVKAFELPQNLRAQWVTADYAAKRRILEIVCLNWTPDGVSLIPTMRKPFDMLAEGLIWKNSRGDWI